MNEKSYLVFQRQIRIIQELGYKVNSWDKILDFGCGNGDIVKLYRDNGFQGYGCDLDFKEGQGVNLLQKNNIIRLINKDRYKIPFEDSYFDFVFSHQGFEHVKNYSIALSEIKRVLKPGGISLHKFSSRYVPVEPHLYVPLASVINKYWWLVIWAFLGIRNNFQKGMSFDEVAKKTLNIFVIGRTTCPRKN